MYHIKDSLKNSRLVGALDIYFRLFYNPLLVPLANIMPISTKLAGFFSLILALIYQGDFLFLYPKNHKNLLFYFYFYYENTL